MSKTTDTDLVMTVDRFDHPIGAVPRSELRSNPALHYRTAHVFVFHRGDLLLQELGPDQGARCGRLGSSVAAYVHPGESYAKAAVRRAREELGLDVRLELVGKLEMAGAGATKLVTLFATPVSSADLQIREPQHVSRVYWRSLEEIAKDISSDSAAFTETFARLFTTFYPDGRARVARSA